MIPFVNIHTHTCSGFVNNEKDNIAVVNIGLTDCGYRHNYISVGIHPWDIGKINISDGLISIQQKCISGELIAIGEIGIDRAIETLIDEQIEVFKSQVEIATTFSLPIIIHCVRAWADLLEVRKYMNNSTPWVLHGFNGNQIIANQLIQKGCFLSFGSRLKQSVKLQEVFKELPLEYLFLETDNCSITIEELYIFAAELRDISIEKLKVQLYSNFVKIFNNQSKA